MSVWYLKRLAVISFSVFITFIEFLYRHMLVLCSGKKERYSVALFEQFLVLKLYLRFCPLRLDPNCEFCQLEPYSQRFRSKFSIVYTNKAQNEDIFECVLCAKGANLVWFFIIFPLILLVKWATLRSGPIKILQKTKKIFWKQQKSKSDMRFRFFLY